MEIGVQQTGGQPVVVGTACPSTGEGICLCGSSYYWGKGGLWPSHLPPREGEHWMATVKTGHYPRLLAHPVQLELRKKKKVEERGIDQRNGCTVDSRVQVWRRSLFLEHGNSYAIRIGPCMLLTCGFLSQRHTKTLEIFQILVLGFPPLFSPLVPVLTTVNQTK